MSFLLALALVASSQASPVALKAEAPVYSDTSAIQWVLPADFDEALARARSQNRLLLIKGVSFGIDAAGASCATAGTW